MKKPDKIPYYTTLMAPFELEILDDDYEENYRRNFFDDTNLVFIPDSIEIYRFRANSGAPKTHPYAILTLWNDYGEICSLACSNPLEEFEVMEKMTQMAYHMAVMKGYHLDEIREELKQIKECIKDLQI